MTRTEERLADALRAAAETVRPGTLRPLTQPDAQRLRGANRAPWRHRAWLVPVAAAAAVTAMTLVSVALTRPASRIPAAPAAPPPYYVLTRASGCCGQNYVIEVRRTSTGHVLDMLNVSKRLGEVPNILGDSLTAASDRHTFFVQVGTTHSRLPVTQIYRFHVTAAGHITGFALVRGIPGGALPASSMAASPDGSRLAIGGELRDGRTVLMIVNVASGTRTTWTGPVNTNAAASSVDDLSWTTDGRTLAFVWWHSQGGPPGSVRTREEVRTIDATRPGGGLAGSRLMFATNQPPGQQIAGVIISPDGTRVDVAILSNYSRKRNVYQNILVNELGSRGVPLRMLYVGEANGSNYYLRTDGFGRLLLASDMSIGWIDHRRLHPLPGGPFWMTDVAW